VSEDKFCSVFLLSVPPSFMGLASFHLFLMHMEYFWLHILIAFPSVFPHYVLLPVLSPSFLFPHRLTTKSFTPQTQHFSLLSYHSPGPLLPACLPPPTGISSGVPTMSKTNRIKSASFSLRANVKMNCSSHPLIEPK